MLTNKTAAVTGGTRGIGLAIVKKYLENGANVVVMGSRKETVDKALAGLTEYEGRVMGLWPDLCDPEAVAEAFASVKERFGSLDILANNAGISSRTSLYDYTVEEFGKILDINVKAVFVCLGINRHCLDSHLPAGTDNPHRDLSPVCDQYFLKHTPTSCYPIIKVSSAKTATLPSALVATAFPIPTGPFCLIISHSRRSRSPGTTFCLNFALLMAPK